MKEYIVRIPLTNISYTLTGSGGNTEIAFASNATERAYICNKGAEPSTDVVIQPTRKFNIRKARLSAIPLPVEGNGTNGMACCFPINITDYLESTTFGSFNVSVSKWNEWEEKDIEVSLSAEEDELGLRGFFQFASGGKAYIYDKNIQDDLVGETITPVLELVIEADVLIDSITGLAI